MTRLPSLATVAPWLFVILWSTGWVVATYANSVAEPLTFLAWRFGFACLLFLAIAFVMRARWPVTRAGWGHAIFSGVLLHTIYLGGVWWAINEGVPTAISGLLAALQPLMTAFVAYWAVSERLTNGQRLGLFLGFAGLVIAIAPRLAGLSGPQMWSALGPLSVNVAAMASVTAGTIYQKRFLQEGGLIPIAGLQYFGALIAIIPAVLLLENGQIDVTLQSALAMAWSVIGLSLGAILLLLYLVRQGQVSRAASLVYLVPPAVGLEAWLLFGDTPTMPFILGTLVVVAGVWLVNRKPRATKMAPPA